MTDARPKLSLQLTPEERARRMAALGLKPVPKEPPPNPVKAPARKEPAAPDQTPKVVAKPTQIMIDDLAVEVVGVRSSKNPHAAGCVDIRVGDIFTVGVQIFVRQRKDETDEPTGELVEEASMPGTIRINNAGLKKRIREAALKAWREHESAPHPAAETSET